MSDPAYEFGDASVDGGGMAHESRDGRGAADNDRPYAFGQRPTMDCLGLFTVHEYARLLVLRSRREALTIAS